MLSSSLLVVDLGGTKLRYFNYNGQSSTSATTIASPRDSILLCKLISSLIYKYRPSVIYFALPGPMPARANLRDRPIIFLPPLDYSVSLDDFFGLLLPGQKLVVSNDMLSFIGCLQNHSLSTDIAVLAIGTSTGLGIYNQQDKSIIFNAYEIAHDYARKYFSIDSDAKVNQILSGTALSINNHLYSLVSISSEYTISLFTVYLFEFIQSISCQFSFKHIYLTGGALLKAYGAQYLHSVDIQYLISALLGIDIKLSILDPNTNYLYSSAVLLSAEKELAGTGFGYIS